MIIDGLVIPAQNLDTELPCSRILAALRGSTCEPASGPAQPWDPLDAGKFVPNHQQGPGLRPLLLAECGGWRGRVLRRLQGQAGTDESVRLAADFVRTKMAALLRQKPEIIEGPIKAHD